MHDDLNEHAYAYAHKMLLDFKTECCAAPVYRNGRADMRCSKCHADVTMELVLLTDNFVRDYKEMQFIEEEKKRNGKLL